MTAMIAKMTRTSATPEPLMEYEMKLHFELMESPYDDMSDEFYTARIVVKKFVDEQDALGNRIHEMKKAGLRGAIVLAIIRGENGIDIPEIER